MADFNRLQAINAELMAYRNGWISYDREHVRQLQEQRRREECRHEHSVTTADGSGILSGIHKEHRPMTIKHTPGPWTIDGNTISGFVDRDMAPHYLAPVCHIDSDWCEPVQAANARLISAAPDLLVALQSLLADKYLSDPINSDRMAAARAAVSKATGE